MIRSAALTTSLDDELRTHLLRKDRAEDMCFALWSPSTGATRTSSLICKAILPGEDERLVHGNVSFGSTYVERSIGVAMKENRGLAVIHSHVGPGWQALSSDDAAAESGLAGAVSAATGLPLVGMTIGTDGTWSARSWERTAPHHYTPIWFQSIRVVGEGLRTSYADHLFPPPAFRPELQRTVSAWGQRVQGDLMRSRIGIVGCGSVGSIVAEAYARMGIRQLTLLDFDSLEEVNLDRCLHGTREDVAACRSKVEALAAGLRKGATADHFQVSAIERSIIEPEGFRAALDCDLLVSCVDRPWPRSVLNAIAYAHLIPVIDGGILVTTKHDGSAIKGAEWRAHTVGPGRRCMECIGQFSPEDASLERDGYLDDPVYIAGLPKTSGLRRNENVFAFSLSVASMEVLQALALIVAPSGLSNIGEKLYHFVTGREDEPVLGACKPTCLYPSLTATGDRAPASWCARHPAAEQAREHRAALRAKLTLADRRLLARLRAWLAGATQWCRALWKHRSYHRAERLGSSDACCASTCSSGAEQGAARSSGRAENDRVS